MSYRNGSLTVNNLVGLLVVLGAAGMAGEARATTCYGSGGLNDTQCDAGGANDICTVSGGTITCDMAANTETQGSDMHALLNSLGTYYHFWGVDGGGDDFCCVISASGITDIDLEGVDLMGVLGTYGDTIDLSATMAPGGTYYLRPPTGGSLDVTVHGNLGDDLIEGSNSVSSAYSEALHGGGGGDRVNGYGGDDLLYGEGGFDFLHGNDGDDLLLGGDDGDQIYGDAGDDTLCGDEDFYWVRPNHLHGGDGDDLLYGGTSTSSSAYADGEGGADDDGCDTSSITGFTGCEYVIDFYPCD